MSPTANEIAEWEHAYRVLGVPASASSRNIKVAWRQLGKRWRPDRCPSGSHEEAEATRMTEILNAAFCSIQTAPLLQYVDVQDGDSTQNPPSSSTAADERPQLFHWYGFWLRFACGALFGALVSFRMVLYAYENPPVMILGVASTILFFAFASGFAGEKLLNWIRGSVGHRKHDMDHRLLRH